MGEMNCLTRTQTPAWTTRNFLSPYLQRRNVQQKPRCNNVIAWSMVAGVACLLLPGAMRPPFSTAMTWALRMMTNLNYCAYTVGKKTVPMFGYFGKIDLPKTK
jgi:hypothetical protein